MEANSSASVSASFRIYVTVTAIANDGATTNIAVFVDSNLGIRANVVVNARARRNAGVHAAVGYGS
eukprot:8752986-Alexandrium_andersonii.AAC.1